MSETDAKLADDLVERITSLVVERLRNHNSLSNPPASAPEEKPKAPTSTPAATAKPANNMGPSERVMTSRLLTLESLQGSLSGVKTIRVPRSTIVTPSVRDELRKKGIRLIVDEATTLVASNQQIPVAAAPVGANPLMGGGQAVNHAAPVASGTVCIAACCESRVADAAVSALAKNIPGSHVQYFANLSELIAALKNDPGAGRAILLTDNPHVALWQLNQTACFQAAWSQQASQIAQICETMQADILVLDPRINSLFELKQMAIQFVRRMGGH